MDCREFADRLDDFVEGLTPPATTSAMEQHRSGCPECRILAEFFGGGLDLAADPLEIDLAPSILARTSGQACGAAEERLGSLIDGSLNSIDAGLVEMHLGRCLDCRSLAAAMAMGARELPLMAEIDPGPQFVQRVVAATSSRGRAGRLAALSDLALRLVVRPRFAFETAYGAALVVWLLFGAPSAPWGVPRERALELARANPVRAVVASSRDLPGWLAGPVDAGRRALADAGGPAYERARTELKEGAVRLEAVGAHLRTLWRSLFEPEPEPQPAASSATQEA